MPFDAPPLFVGPLVIAFAAYMLRYAIRSRRWAAESPGWPRVEGVVTKSEAVQWKATSPHTSWVVGYTYTVGGVPYEGTQPAFYALSRDEAAALADRYPEGASVPVYADPKAPATSVLVPGDPTGRPHSGVAIAALALALGVALTAASLWA